MLKHIHGHVEADSAHGEHEEVSETEGKGSTHYPSTCPTTQARLATKEGQ